jgi:signal transduction histidine kinase
MTVHKKITSNRYPASCILLQPTTMALRRLRTLIFAVCFFFVMAPNAGSFAQTRTIDSLKVQLNKTSTIHQQHKKYLLICEQHYSLSADSLALYISRGLATPTTDLNTHFKLKNFYSHYYFKQGNPTEAIRYLDSLQLEAESNDVSDEIKSQILYNTTIARIRDSKHKEAIASGLMLLKNAELSGDTLSVLKAYSAIGWANMELENEAEAMQWLMKGIRYTSNTTLLANTNSLFLNLASCYNITNQTDSALLYVNQGLAYSIQIENLTNQANALNIRASIYSRQEQRDKALVDLEKAIAIRKKIGDLHYIISDMGLLSHFYAYINQPHKGIAIAMEGIPLAIQSNNLYKLIYLKRGLAKNYQALNRMHEYSETLVEIIQLKDSLYEKNTATEIAALSSKYELQKKETLILKQKNALLRNQYFTVAAVLGLLFVSIIFWLAYRNYTHIQKRHLEKALADEKIQSIKAVQLAEENERKRIAADLHDNLGSYAAAITANIRHLKEKTLSDDTQLIAQLDENAQGIVTQLSDSIWVLKNEQLPITKLADRFKAWTQRIIRNYPDIRYHYSEEIIEDVELKPTRILNIFLILKECLNNALRHSHCTEIKIRFVSNTQIEISLEDNGKGFDIHAASPGNGIANIKKRAVESDLQVTWQNSLPTGTRITIVANTTN